MRTRSAIILGLSLAWCWTGARAQVPYILGTWKLDAAASRLPGRAPRTQLRQYSLAKDGKTLIGLAVIVDAAGNPNFLQFAAMSDGKDYPEFDSRTLARFQIDASKTPRTYSETPIDAHTVAWTDKYQGKVIASGKKWVSEDGRTLSFTATSTDNRGRRVEYLYVFDRQ